jgi:hypothetical protein
MVYICIDLFRPVRVAGGGCSTRPRTKYRDLGAHKRDVRCETCIGQAVGELIKEMSEMAGLGRLARLGKAR